MRALTVRPGTAGSVNLEDIPPPAAGDGALLAHTVAIGVCGTDRDIVAGRYGALPAGRERLVLGHESLLRVVEAPAAAGFAAGDLVAGIVRRPDPVPCASCAIGEWDMCTNGRYTERGIKGRDGYAAEQVRLDPAFAVRLPPALGVLGVLTEPASVLAKAWEQIERIGSRAGAWEPRTVLVTGAGPVGLLAALMGRQRGLDVHVYDRTTDGPKPALVRDLGAHYHCPDLESLGDCEPNIVIECTGASAVVFDVMNRTTPGGIVCLAGMSSGGREIRVDVAQLNRALVLENDVVFGTVSANRRHYDTAVQCLAAADPGWLARLITRRVPLARWREALEPRRGDVKVVLDF